MSRDRNHAANDRASIDERRNQVVELRLFGGWTVEEPARFSACPPGR
jgi:hypothetical protein